MVILVRAGEELHGGYTGIDESGLIAGAEIILHGVDGDAGDKACAAENMHQFARGSGAEHCDRIVLKPPDGIQIQHRDYFLGWIIFGIADVMLGAEQIRFLSGESDKNNGAFRLPFGHDLPRQFQ